MAKLFLLSVMIAVIALPARAARSANPRLGFRKALIHASVFFAFYVAGLIWVNGRSGAVNGLYMLAIVLVYRYFFPIQAKHT